MKSKPNNITAIANTGLRNRLINAILDEPNLSTTAERRGYSWDGPSRRSGLRWTQPLDGIVAAAQVADFVLHALRP